MTMNDRINRTFVRQGFRGEMMVLWALSDLLEKNPDLPRPSVTLPTGKDSRPEIRWAFSASYAIDIPYSDENGRVLDSEERTKRWEDLRRVDLEDRMAAVITALGPDLEWEKNDPTVDKWSYVLNTVWNGAAVQISTWREAVCERVTVLEKEVVEEVPDPELVKEVPLVKVTRKEPVTEWQCNPRLSEVTAPRHIRAAQTAG